MTTISITINDDGDDITTQASFSEAISPAEPSHVLGVTLMAVIRAFGTDAAATIQAVHALVSDIFPEPPKVVH
ncbi:hypothetical protein [Pusillimonas sp.]|uniref:hypothetical protein n=1 Tax=Pusillimonas sp. TaxID=3040095 RepID=UPI0037CAB072